MPAGAVGPEEPKRPRIITSDTTPESLAGIMAANPKGLVNQRDELAGWLNGFERYNNGSARQFWLEAWGGRPYTVDRVKAGGAIQIPRLSISVFGGIQPDRLSSLLLKGDDDGLPARFVWFWPDKLPPKRPARFADGQFVRSAFSRLRGLRPGQEDGVDVPIVIHLDAKAADTFQEWRITHDRVTGGVAGLLESAWGKMPGLVLRLAMVLEMAAWSVSEAGTPEPATIDRAAILRAIALVETYIKPMAARVYGDAAGPIAERHATVIARWIEATGVDRINAREIRRTAGLPGLREVAPIEAAFAVLEDMCWIRPDGSATGGRPRKDYLVNPAVTRGALE
jgi:putative DNA primase/helicase